MPGWGTGSWGLGPWGGIGGLGGGPLAFAGAVATSTNSVLVQLTAQPLAQSPIGVGDALNPLTWTIEREDNGFIFTVIAVNEISPDEFELRTLEKFGGWLITHTVSSVTLVDGGGNPITPPTSQNFPGVEAVAQPYEQAGVADFDLANPQTPESGVPGTIPTTAAGDYETVAGRDLAEKLIIRAISTATGAFFHLPNYGFGLAVKQNVTPSKLGSLKKNLIFVVEAIPMIDAADATITFDNASGILTVTVIATLRNTGQSVTVVNKIPTRGIQLS